MESYYWNACFINFIGIAHFKVIWAIPSFRAMMHLKEVYLIKTLMIFRLFKMNDFSDLMNF